MILHRLAVLFLILLVITQTSFIVLKVTNVLSWDWWLVLMPVWSTVGAVICFIAVMWILGALVNGR